MAIKKIKTNPFDEQEFIDDLLYPLQGHRWRKQIIMYLV